MSNVKYLLILIFMLFMGLPSHSQKDTVCNNISQINSSSDEYLPFLIDSTLFFTSNRKNTQEGQTLEYSEKAYWSIKKDGEWSKSKKVGYKWNSDNNTALIGISPLYFYFYRSYWKDNGDIFSAERKNDNQQTWKAFRLKKVKNICSDFNETSIAHGNGDTIFFVSNRNGNYDVFMQTGNNKAVALEVINSAYDEQDVFLSNDFKTLYFSSNRPGGKGGFDIYFSEKNSNQWSKPLPVTYTGVNTEWDDRDFRKYNDSTLFLSSARTGGSGGFDIYEILIKTRKTIIIKDSVVTQDTVVEKKQEEVIEKLTELGLNNYRGEVQLGAYRFIKSVADFKKKFPCINSENIRMDTIKIDGFLIHKFIIDTLYIDMDKALGKQLTIINLHCLPEQSFSDIPFVALLDEATNRYAIFWKKDEFVNKNIFYIFRNGQQIWKSRKF